MLALPRLYAVFISEDTVGLIQFLQDGEPVRVEDMGKYYTFHIHGKNSEEIRSNIMTLEQLYENPQFKNSEISTIF